MFVEEITKHRVSYEINISQIRICLGITVTYRVIYVICSGNSEMQTGTNGSSKGKIVITGFTININPWLL